MTDTPDSTSTDSRSPDPQGQAALMLVESLIHQLIANATLSIDQAIKVVVVATEVKKVFAEETDERRAALDESLAILDAIAASLRVDAR